VIDAGIIRLRPVMITVGAAVLALFRLAMQNHQLERNGALHRVQEVVWANLDLDTADIVRDAILRQLSGMRFLANYESRVQKRGRP